jgi:hypothetical protein
MVMTRTASNHGTFVTGVHYTSDAIPPNARVFTIETQRHGTQTPNIVGTHSTEGPEPRMKGGKPVNLPAKAVVGVCVDKGSRAFILNKL